MGSPARGPTSSKSVRANIKLLDVSGGEGEYGVLSTTRYIPSSGKSLSRTLVSRASSSSSSRSKTSSEEELERREEEAYDGESFEVKDSSK